MSEKLVDPKGRWRNKIVAFRVSEQEWNELNHLVALSGLHKQDYLTTKVLDKEIHVYANPRVYKALKQSIEEIMNKLSTVNVSDLDEETLVYLEDILKVYVQLKGDENNV